MRRRDYVFPARLIALIVLLFSFANAVPGAAVAGTVVMQDAQFVSTDWTTTVQVLNLGGTVGVAQVVSGGNPAAFRQVTNNLNSAIGQGFSNTVFGFHRFSGGIFTPTISGAILTIDYSEDSERITGGVQACGVACRQNSVIYYGPSFLNPTSFSVWATSTQSGLTAASFDALAPGLQTPDFSVTGSPIEWGFFRANSTSVGGGPGSTVGGIDNWKVTLHTDEATPSRSTSWGRVQALYAR